MLPRNDNSFNSLIYENKSPNFYTSSTIDYINGKEIGLSSIIFALPLLS